jgi:tetratricopeptide (TPR) repeat protein
MRGLRGKALEVARRGAFRALRDVSRRFEGSASISAEAAFRAGELARAGGWRNDAREAFESAVEKGADTPFQGRGLLELGHLERRASNPARALAHYEAALLAPAAAGVLQDSAALWRGRMQLEMGRVKEARASWWRVASHGLNPLHRIRAHALIAASWSDEGNPERACAVLQACHVACEHEAAEISDLGTRVRRALVRLSCE